MFNLFLFYLQETEVEISFKIWKLEKIILSMDILVQSKQTVCRCYLIRSIIGDNINRVTLTNWWVFNKLIVSEVSEFSVMIRVSEFQFRMSLHSANSYIWFHSGLLIIQLLTQLCTIQLLVIHFWFKIL